MAFPQRCWTARLTGAPYLSWTYHRTRPDYPHAQCPGPSSEARSSSNSSVRTQLRILEEKGVIEHETLDGKFIYKPLDRREDAAENALASVVKTFFRGSISQTVASLITQGEAKLSPREISEIEKLIAHAKENGQ